MVVVYLLTNRTVYNSRNLVIQTKEHEQAVESNWLDSRVTGTSQNWVGRLALSFYIYFIYLSPYRSMVAYS